MTQTGHHIKTNINPDTVLQYRMYVNGKKTTKDHLLIAEIATPIIYIMAKHGFDGAPPNSPSHFFVLLGRVF